MTRMMSKTLSAFVVVIGIAGFASVAQAECAWSGHKSVTETEGTTTETPTTVDVPKTVDGDAT